MRARYFALIAGIVYLLVGIVGFIPGLTTAPMSGSPALSVDASYGYVFGLFPVNILHNLVHLLIGLWGVLAYGSFGAARGFSRSLAIIYGILTIMGLIPGLDTVFGLVPLFGNDIWLHALTAIIAAYFGWFVRGETDYGNPTVV